jgi:membrane associated rhomboid family serine protease
VIPLRDSEADRRFTPINTILIVANLTVFFLELRLGRHAGEILGRFAMVPAHLTDHAKENPRIFETIVTSMFLHAGWGHVLGNMLYLFIFGPAVEERMRPVRYLLFYLLSGIVAALALIAMTPDSRVAVVGASGAIAGVLGAYLVLFPRARITTILPIFIFIQFVQIPAILYLLIWFAVQLYSGIISGAAGTMIGGVAWWAHVGGFLFGLAIAPILARNPMAQATSGSRWRRRVV